MVDGSPVTGSAGRALDGTKRGSETWKQHTKAIERIISVVLTVDQPKTAKAIAEEAQVAEQTARDHLGLLQDLSIVGSTAAYGVTKYHPDDGYLRFRAVAGMIEEYDKEELLDLSQELKERNEGVKDQYGVETPDDLRSQAISDESNVEEMTELRQAASEWESLRRDLSVIEQAYEQYEEYNGTGTSASA
jgi:predicted ArsR family transcriptional regulator